MDIGRFETTESTLELSHSGVGKLQTQAQRLGLSCLVKTGQQICVCGEAYYMAGSLAYETLFEILANLARDGRMVVEYIPSRAKHPRVLFRWTIVPGSVKCEKATIAWQKCE